MSTSVLLTGFPSNELARRVLPRLLEGDRQVRVTLLVPERFVDHANEWLSALPNSQRERTTVLVGDVAALDLGLSGREYLELAAEVRTIHHCAAVTYSGAPIEMAKRVNVGGTFEVLELARNAAQLERVVHWSTISASAGRQGVVNEDELVEPRSNPLALTRFRAEKLVAKARAEVPVTVVRTAMLVGDSKTGRLARIEGAHLLIASLLNAPRDVPIMRPAHGHAQLQVVPIDYAVEAGLAIASDADSIGHTYQVIDRAALSLDEALCLIADIVGKPQPRGGVPPAFAQAVMRLPGLDRLVHAQRALLDEIGRDVRYDDRNAQVALSRRGLSCPPFASYVNKLVTHVERERKSDRPLPTYSRGAHG
jgi:thioester reductase-like protein